MYNLSPLSLFSFVGLRYRGLSAGDIVHLDLYAELLIQDFVHFFVYLRHFFLDRVYVSSGCLTLQDAKLHKVYTKSLCNLVRLNHSSTVV